MRSENPMTKPWALGGYPESLKNWAADPGRPLVLDYRQIGLEHFLVGFAECVRAKRSASATIGRAGGWAAMVLPFCPAAMETGLAKQGGTHRFAVEANRGLRPKFHNPLV